MDNILNIIELKDLVENKKYTLQQLSEHYNKPLSTIRYQMIKNGIKAAYDRSIKPPVEELARLAAKGLNPHQIAIELCKDRTTVARWLKNYGIETTVGHTTNKKAQEKMERDAINIEGIKVKHNIGDLVKVTGEFQSPDGNVKVHSRLGHVFKKNRDVTTIRFENYAEGFLNKDIARKVIKMERVGM